METMQEYVVRKLNDPAINISAVSKQIDMNRSKIYRVKGNGETSARTLIALYEYFKSLGD